MRSIYKGVILGAANTIAVAATIGGVVAMQAQARYGAETFVLICFFGMLPGVFAGAFLGWLADYLDSGRTITLLTVACYGVVMLGGATERDLIAPACVPTIITSILLARWTRVRQPSARAPADELSGAIKGLLVGIGNVFVVAVLVGVTIATNWTAFGLGHGPAAGTQIAITIMFLGLMPGIVTGAALGWFVSRLDDCRPVLRVVMLAMPAAIVVAILGLWTRQPALIIPAGVPTLIACAVLEQWTRKGDLIPWARITPRDA